MNTDMKLSDDHDGGSLPEAQFRFDEHSRENIFDGILDVVLGKRLGVICRNFLSNPECQELLNGFSRSPELRSRADGVPGSYLGTYHYGKDLKTYFEESEYWHDKLLAFISSFPSVSRFFESLAETAARRKIILRPASHPLGRACPFIVRSFTDKGKFLLLPHEDLSQLSDKKQSGFEIQDAEVVSALNMCLENDGRFGKLKLWNLLPSAGLRQRLGILSTGYPYPMDVLDSRKSITLEVNPGDIYVFNGCFVHGVTAFERSEELIRPRVTVSNLLAKLKGHSVVYWS